LPPKRAMPTILAKGIQAALSIGFRPLLAPSVLWLGVGVLIGADLWMGQRMIDNVSNWQFV
jgi:hypothetical protein